MSQDHLSNHKLYRNLESVFGQLETQFLSLSPKKINLLSDNKNQIEELFSKISDFLNSLKIQSTVIIPKIDLPSKFDIKQFGNVENINSVQIKDEFLKHIARDLKRLEELAQERNIIRLSQDYLKIIRFKLLLQGLESLQKLNIHQTWDKENSLFFLSALVTFENCLRTLDALNILFQTKSDIVVLTVGSAGEDIQQKCPNFIQTLSKTNKIDVINIDPNFNSNGFIAQLSEKNLHVYGFEGFLDGKISFKALHESHETIQSLFYDFLSHLLQKTQTKIVLLENRSPELESLFVKIGNQFHNKIGTQLNIIGSYFKDCPVLVYNAQLFKQTKEEKKNETNLHFN